MQVKETKSDGLKKAFNIIIDAQTITDNVTAKIKNIGENAALPGFRKGKVPESFLRQRYEKAVLGEVVDDIIQRETTKTLNERSLRPAVRPAIKIVSFADGKDLEFTVDVEVLPEITPVDFSTISLEKITAQAPAEEVEKALNHLASARTETEAVTERRAAKNGDVVVIDFEGSVDGTPFAGGKGTDYSLELGSHTFIPGFEAQIEGRNVGDKFDVNVTFPENYHADNLAGKDAVFAVTLKELRQRKPVVMDDKFAESFGKKTMDELKASVKDELSREYEAVSMNHLKRTLLDALSAAHDFPVPESMLTQEFDAIWKQLETAKSKNQLDEEDKGKSDDELKAEYKSIAERRVRLGLLLAEIGMKNKIDVTDADLNRAILAEARNFPGQEKAVFDFYAKHPEMLDRLRAPLFEEKVVDFILKAVKLTEKEVSVEELYKTTAEINAAKPAEAKKAGKKAAAKKADSTDKKEEKAAKSSKKEGKIAEDAKEKPAKKRSCKKKAAE